MQHRRITVTPITHLPATAIMDMGRTGRMGLTGLHTGSRLTPSRIALGASVPTTPRARPFFHIAASVFPVRSGRSESGVE